MNVLDKLDKKMKISEVAKNAGLTVPTVRNIKNCTESIMNTASQIATNMADTVTKIRNFSMNKMKSLLYVWILDQRCNNVPLSLSIIQSKALSIF